MIRWVLRRAIDKVEREWNYDASHIGDMIDASPRAAWMMVGLIGMALGGLALARSRRTA